MKLKVNVIVPVYNVAPYLNTFFESLLSQTFQDFDVWVVDDNSTDNSPDIIRRFAERFPDKIHVIRNTVNLGLCGARNVGLDICAINEGKYILILDSDDYIEPRYMEKMVGNAEQYNADITICGLERFDDKTGEIVCVEMLNNPENLVTDIKGFEMLGYINPVVWNKLYRKDIIGDARFTKIKRSEDTIFLFSLLPNVKSLKFINEVLYHYRLRDESLSGSITDEIYESMLEGFQETKKYFITDGRYNDFMELFVVQMFIRCGIGGACRLSFKGMRRMPYYVSRTKKYMDEHFPEWRTNKYLLLRHCWGKDFHMLAVSFAATLYKCHLFGLFVYVYWFMIYVCRKDFRA